MKFRHLDNRVNFLHSRASCTFMAARLKRKVMRLLVPGQRSFAEIKAAVVLVPGRSNSVVEDVRQAVVSDRRGIRRDPEEGADVVRPCWGKVIFVL